MTNERTLVERLRDAATRPETVSDQASVMLFSHSADEIERCEANIETIRAKDMAKPKRSPLPCLPDEPAPKP